MVEATLVEHRRHVKYTKYFMSEKINREDYSNAKDTGTVND